MFNLAHKHGDMLREGWKNILDCMMTLYRARLLPDTFTEVEDFLNPERRIKIIKDNKLPDSRYINGNSLFYHMHLFCLFFVCFTFMDPVGESGKT